MAFSQPVHEDWYLSRLNIPQKNEPVVRKKGIVIAIVDDGVRITHNELKDFVWNHPKETPQNNMDDDGNGFTDDVHGWDVSDHDNSVSPPLDRLSEFYHGTHLASIVTRIAYSYFGDSASEFVKIMPVKNLSDQADRTYLRDGFKGIKYAIQAGADIILCSWNVAHISREEIEILEEAHRKGVLVVASAGNFSADKKQYPAAHPTVIAVAASNKNNEKSKESNYGQYVDLTAPGIDIYGASSLSDTDYDYRDGTSFSTAMVAAAAALILWEHPEFSDRQIEACLKSSADTMDIPNALHVGKLGSGQLNIGAAVKCGLLVGDTKEKNFLTRPEGVLNLSSVNKNSITWVIQPQGEFKGIRFKPISAHGDTGNSIIKFYSNDLTESNFIESYPLSSPPESIYVAGPRAYVVMETDPSDKNFDGLLEYEIDPIDFRNLYCRGTQNIYSEGSIEDGSGIDKYSMETNCKWIISAPKGKVINFKFSEFDTEPLTDWVYFFNGTNTQQANIMAGFSGPEIPPELTTWSNQVLVWFVTDGKNQGSGWKAGYSFQNDLE